MTLILVYTVDVTVTILFGFVSFVHFRHGLLCLECVFLVISILIEESNIILCLNKYSQAQFSADWLFEVNGRKNVCGCNVCVTGWSELLSLSVCVCVCVCV